MMRFRNLVLAGFVLLFADPVQAQSTKTAADPISGTWTGYMARDNGDRQPLTFTMKFDGTALSGTVVGPPKPGTIRTGTFDRASGALNFEVAVADSETVARFEGKVLKDAASGTVTLDGQTGTFNLTKNGSSSGAAARNAEDETTLALRKGFTQVGAYVAKSADMVPAEKYSYRPSDSVRTFGQLIGHVIDGYNYFCAAGAGRKAEWSDATEKGATDKAALAQKLKQATDACTATYGTGGKPGALIDNLGHTNLHYGNIITYMRMLGLVPPSS
jgi:uncharacterized damage-inducible protein DinB